MILLLLAGCGFVVLYTCTYNVSSLTLVKFGLMITLPGGIIEQEVSANSQSATVVSDILEDIAGVMMVGSELH